MADWSDVAFDGRRKLRLAKDYLPLLAVGLRAGNVVIFAAYVIIASTTCDLPWSQVLPGTGSGTWAMACCLGGLLLAIFLSKHQHDDITKGRLGWRTLARTPRRILLFIAFAAVFAVLVFTTLKPVVSPALWGAGISLCWLLGSRMARKAFSERMAQKELGRRGIVIVGAEAAQANIIAALSDNAHIVKVYDPANTDAFGAAEIEQIAVLGQTGAVDTVLVAPDGRNDLEIKFLIDTLRVLPLQIAVSGTADWSMDSAPSLRLLGDPRLKIVVDQPIQRTDLLLKCLLDKLGAVVLLALLAPLFCLAAIAVLLSSPGSIIFRQVRQGWCGGSFTMFKFRTMREPPEGGFWRHETVRRDPRCTPVGRFLRKTSFDELPQLINVLRGEMSLVGPRPHARDLHGLDQVGREIVAEYAQRHRVKPGITGWAQIHGARGATGSATQMRRRVALDLYYCEHWSFYLDFFILLRTPFNLVGENAF